ncbi:hypothetical protein RCL1_005152 [Eukaryota sp. TZLM3-RCL]
MSYLQDLVVEGKTGELATALKSGKFSKQSFSEEITERSLLHIACKEGRTAIVELLCENGQDVNVRDAEGATPLHISCLFNRAACVKVLLKYGAETHLADVHGDKASHYAAIGNAVDAFKVLAHHGGVSVDDVTDGMSKLCPLHFAAQTNAVDIGFLLLSNGASVEGVEGSMETPLHIAARKGHEAFIYLLLTFKADPNSLDTMEKTPLMEAARYGLDNVCRVLIAAGSSLSLKDSLKRNAMRHARLGDHKRTESLLASALLHQEEWQREFNAMIKLREARALLNEGSFLPMGKNIEEEAELIKRVIEKVKGAQQVAASVQATPAKFKKPSRKVEFSTLASPPPVDVSAGLGRMQED